ncbi:glycosyltransferase family 4 protein [Geomesophilobacter sediminis]|uniref:Glycosyltransferase family 4 protein n=1 Tax=Geomesophilobacter sediminis TaxID=2798584 RepID=A0A8J7M240_9BACT|nr:glycosyltransferase family 4 protein [Geomesophilobacter sediminis]MBJ6727309.1 glycosyltransferase family 4 protein [Geomesophilobacter sediminis]
MKVLYLNGADNEGGAAKAALRLLHGMRAQGVDGALYVQRKFGTDPAVVGPANRLARAFGFARPTIEQAILGIRPAKLRGPFCAAYLPDRLLPQIERFAPDLVHLHWVARMMRIETLSRIRRPIVWTMHDSWPFTGGCYLPGECTRYADACGACPVLCSRQPDDLSAAVLRRKKAAWNGLDLTLVAPSRWMAERARLSSLFRDAPVEVIPNGIDVERYRPVPQEQARRELSLPQDKMLVLFGAKGVTSDANKGFHLLTQALQQLAAAAPAAAMEVVVFGGAPGEPRPDLGIPAHYVGWQNEDAALARLYAAADVFVLPSLQENLPFTVMEAMACGTPCVAFDQGGVPDLIDHRVNGYLARAHDPADLAAGIGWVLADPQRRRQLGERARQKVLATFSLPTMTQRYRALYQRLLSRRQG